MSVSEAVRDETTVEEGRRPLPADTSSKGHVTNGCTDSDHSIL